MPKSIYTCLDKNTNPTISIAIDNIIIVKKQNRQLHNFLTFDHFYELLGCIISLKSIITYQYLTI